MKKQILLLTFILLLLSGCAGTSTGGSKRKFIPKNPAVLDVEYPQNVDKLPSVGREHAVDGAKFKERYFKVWDADKVNVSPSDALWGLNYAKGIHFDIHGNLHSQSVYDNIHANANQSAFGSVAQPAITTNNTLLRNIPSDVQIFGDPSKPGEGEPFDYVANSALGAGYPLFISHYSSDNMWAFVENDGVWGWVKSADIKQIGINGANAYKSSKFIAILRDNTPLYDKRKQVILRARTGTILPYDFAGDGVFGGKMIGKNGMQPYFVSTKHARVWPAKLNDENTRLIAASLIGQRYGWGGYKLLRDCSLLTKDFLANFGLWLPRNSKAQSKRGKILSLAGMSMQEKLNFISHNGVPYASIIYMPGHVMLYIGEINGAPAVLHNVWGLRTKDDGRAVLGRTVISSLTIGENRADIADERLLVSRISALTIVPDNNGGASGDVSIKELFGIQ